MKPEINSYVRTPRFCSVKIHAIFTDEAEARICGYTEPTYYRGDYKVLGKSIGNNCMVFAAVTNRD